MPPRHASLARISLLLAAALPCAWSQATPPPPAPTQTTKPIPLNAPKPKPPETAKPIQLGTTIKSAEATKPTEIVEEAPPPPEAPVKSFAPAPVFDAALEAQIRTITAASHGKVALYAWQLNTSKAVAIDADQTIQTTSVIQLAMLWETLRQIALGNINWDEPIPTKPAAATLRDATVSMVNTGDTAVPNLLAERFTPKRVDQDLTTFGYNGDALDRKPVKHTAPIPDRTTPRQMVRLLQHIGMCDLDLPTQLHVNINRADAACTTAVTLMRARLYRDAMPAPTTPAQQNTGVLTRTGALSTGPSQVAILAARSGPIVVAMYAYDTPSAIDAQASLTSITSAILNAWSPAGMDSALLDKPHLGVSWE